MSARWRDDVRVRPPTTDERTTSIERCHYPRPIDAIWTTTRQGSSNACRRRGRRESVSALLRLFYVNCINFQLCCRRCGGCCCCGCYCYCSQLWSCRGLLSRVAAYVSRDRWRTYDVTQPSNECNSGKERSRYRLTAGGCRKHERLIDGYMIVMNGLWNDTWYCNFIVNFTKSFSCLNILNLCTRTANPTSRTRCIIVRAKWKHCS